jgi:3-phenylpropionate/trans-cinnamate dioxygenase ferredoxin subunit
MGSFQKVCAAEEVAPGTAKSFDVGGKQIAVFNIEGTYHAIDDACPHAGAPLSDGDVRDGKVTCYLHGAVFDLATGECSGPIECGPATRYPVRVVDGQVEVEL